MKRAPIVISATVAGMAAVLAFQPHQPEFVSAASSAAVPSTTADSSTSSTTSTDSTDTGSSSSGSTDSGSTSSSGTDSSGSSTTSSSSGSTSSGTKSYSGDAVSTQYGDAQVKVTITDGKITDVVALQLQSNDPRSVQISTSAEPLLKASALAKQSADIDMVSGATFTSASYATSLQSALDQAGFEAADGSRSTAVVPTGGDGGGFGH